MARSLCGVPGLTNGGSAHSRVSLSSPPPSLSPPSLSPPLSSVTLTLARSLARSLSPSISPSLPPSLRLSHVLALLNKLNHSLSLYWQPRTRRQRGSSGSPSISRNGLGIATRETRTDSEKAPPSTECDTSARGPGPCGRITAQGPRQDPAITAPGHGPTSLRVAVTVRCQG
jgi:hypothetical protein